MKIIYLILAHKNFPQLERMVTALQGENTSFYIHVDRESNIQQAKALPALCAANITFLSRRVSINWGGYNMVRATLGLMKAAAKEKGAAYQVLLSGQDFPLITNPEIRDFFLGNYGKEFVQYWSLPHADWTHGGLDRIKQYWFIDDIGLEQSKIIAGLQYQSGFERTGFFDFPFFGGSQWWCLTDRCVNYILGFIKTNPVILEYFEKTLIPDELLFQTIVLNSPFKDNVVNNNLRYIVFEEDASHPNILMESSISELRVCGKLWARKFNQEKDPVILDLIEESIKERGYPKRPAVLNN